MIEINLLPEAQRKKAKAVKSIRSTGEFIKTKFTALPAGIAGTVILIEVILLLIMLSSKAGLNGLIAKQKALEPNGKVVEALKQEEKFLSARASCIDEIYKNRTLWSKKLNDLSDSVTTGIWLTSLSVAQETIQEPAVARQKAKKYITRSLSITGRAVSTEVEETALVGKFVKSLDDNESFMSDFDDVTLVSSKRGKIKEVDVMEFTLSCLFKAKEEAF